MTVDDAFERLYEEVSPAAFRVSLAICGVREVAEDATQEAFARALARWDRLRHVPWAGGWVVTTAMNVARRSRRRVAPSVTHPSPDDPDLRSDVWRALRELPRRQREAVVLRYLLDLQLNEIGHVMGCSVGSVKVHLHRGRRALERRLEVEA